MKAMKCTSLKVSGFNAFGYPVPKNRLQNAYKAVQEMLGKENKELAHTIVSKCANWIERDEPYEIVGRTPNSKTLDKDVGQLDLTGRYRLLAHLLTD